MKKTRLIILMFAIVFLHGCSSVSPVIPVGKNTYRVSSEMGGQLSSWSDVKNLSLKEANEFCIKQNKYMKEGSWETHGARGWTPLNAELTFQCVK